jgi:transcriptional regulator with GAF, ATPase, and Fis domain
VNSTNSTPSKTDQALERITLEMTSNLELDDVLNAVTQGLVEDLNAAAARLWLLQQEEGKALEEGELNLRASAGLAPPVGAPVPSKIRGIAQGRHKHLCTNSLPADDSLGPRSWLLANGLVAFAGLPLLFRGNILGVLAIDMRRQLEKEEFERLFVFANTAAVAIQNARLFSQVDGLNRRLKAENLYLQEEVQNEINCGDIVGRSAAILGVLKQVEQVADTDASVLVEGETGTGKELVARAIHKRSRRRDRTMVKVNCGAISAGLVESELFGHEKGAFTGAVERRVGRFELADGGTLFLDEVAELPPETQVKLLRAVQEQEFERVGSSKPIKVDVRVIAAGNRDLAAEVAAGRFRADLYYRLNVFPIRVPPLRERKDDIPLIAGCVLPRLAENLGRPMTGFAEGSLQRLLAYDWPGNVRELLNVLERAMILSRGPELEITDRLLLGGIPGAGGSEVAVSLGKILRPLDEVEREHILRVLDHTDGVIEGKRGAAPILGLHPNTLRSRMLKLGVERPSRTLR